MQTIERNTIEAGKIRPVFESFIEGKHGDSWTRIAVFRRKVIEVQCGVKAPRVPVRFDESFQMTFPDFEAMSDEERDRLHAVTEAAEEASGFYPFERGPGRAFASEPSARVYTRFVVVKWHGGLDV